MYKENPLEMAQLFVVITTVILSAFMVCLRVYALQSAWCLQRPDDDIGFCGTGIKTHVSSRVSTKSKTWAQLNL